MCFLLLLLLQLIVPLLAGFPRVPCPTSALPIGTAKRAAKANDWPLARACFAVHYAHAQGAKQATALQALQHAQLQLLLAEQGAPQDPSFSPTFTELMRLMVWKNIMNLPELDALSSRWDVYLLHGQLACMEEKGGAAGRAVSSLAHALSMRESAAVRRLLARISLGRGDTEGALRSATIARGHREAPADSATALMMQFQALALWGSGSIGGAGASVGTAGSVAPLAPVPAADPEEVWEEVRELISVRFGALGVELPPRDPLLGEAVPLFLAPPPPAAGGSRAVSASAAAAAVEQGQWREVSTGAAAREWAEKGYTVLRGLVPPAYLQALQQRHRDLFFPRDASSGGEGRNGGLRIEPDEDQKRRLLWDEELSLYVGVRILPAITNITGGRPLSNTYTCSIAYNRGGDLKPHVDREQNAISLSLNLGLWGGGEDPEEWPLYVSPEGKGEEAGMPVRLKPNDALLYGGVHHTHFRYPLTQADSSMQVIFGFREMAPGHCNSQ